MTKFESLPEEVRSKLKTDIRHTSGNELLPAQVAEVMYENKRPIWTPSRMRAELQTGHRTETVRNKLKSLDEMGICESMEANNGRVYWWNDSRSEWPIPPDVVVEGQEKLTIEQALEPWYAKVGAIGLLGPTLAGIPLIIGVYVLAGTISSPIPGAELLSIGLITIFISFFLLAFAAIIGIIQWATGDAIDLDPESLG